MREHEIRAALRDRLVVEFASEPNTLFVDELGIEQGSFRVDLAVVNGALHGFEIKSTFDTLVRLPSQADAYGRVFDKLTVVVAAKHLDSARSLLPSWWGVLVTRTDGLLVERRRARPNRGIDAYALAQLLWREEALATLEDFRLADAVRSKPRRELWEALAAGLPLDELRMVVRDRLRARRTWRADPSRS